MLYTTQNKIEAFYILAFLILFLQSMHVWFLWGSFFKVVCPILFLYAAYLNHKKNPTTYTVIGLEQRKMLLFILFFLAIRGTYDAGLLSICKSVVGILVLYEITKLSETSLKKLLEVITKIFGIISIISLFGWILFLIGMSLPNEFIVDEEFGYSFENYYIFLYNRMGLIPRFCSIFLEPGYYGQLASVILFANRMKLNNFYTITIFVGVLFSLSLAGYVLVGLGFIFLYFSLSRIKYLVFVLLVGVFLVNYAKSYNGGDNPINELIFARMEIEDGKLSGDDRSSYELDKYIENEFIASGKFLLGVGSTFESMDWGKGVAGYKVYLVQNGYIGLALAVIGYLLMLYRQRKATIQMFLSFVLFMAMYWQAAYPYWFGFFTIYLICLAVYRNPKENVL